MLPRKQKIYRLRKGRRESKIPEACFTLRHITYSCTYLVSYIPPNSWNSSEGLHRRCSSNWVHRILALPSMSLVAALRHCPTGDRPSTPRPRGCERNLSAQSRARNTPPTHRNTYPRDMSKLYRLRLTWCQKYVSNRRRSRVSVVGFGGCEYLRMYSTP